MNVIKRIALPCILAIGLIFFSHCKNKSKDNFTITIHYKNLDKMVPQAFGNGESEDPFKIESKGKVLLMEIPYGGDMNPVVLDSATLKGNDGTIVLHGSGKEEALYQLAVGKGPMLLLIDDANDIQVDLDLSKTDNYYSVKNSEASSLLQQFILEYSKKSFAVNRSFNELDSLKQVGASDSLLILSTTKKNNAIKDLNNYLHEVLDKSEHPALSLFALGWSSRSFPKEEFERALNASVIKFPEHQTFRKLKTTYDAQKAAQSQQPVTRDNPNSWIGKPAPPLALPDVNGDTISVASFKGKYLLVDFWASWCRPCRQENPNVVKAFNRFKDKNFTILGVSLDQKKPFWLKAIEEDQLTWTHISDLKYWDSKAVEVYRFDGIPFNVLIDPKGIVIAENLRGFDLENKLQQVLK